jgi:RecA-family ATPase
MEQGGCYTADEWLGTYQESKSVRIARAAAEFGEDDTHFLWYPYLPIGDYCVMMADGGTGKTILSCGIAAAISNGELLPGDESARDPRNVLFISAEDSGEMLKRRLNLSGANLERVFILDRSDSIDMNFSERYEEFEATVKAYSPALVIIDPWHAFLGENVDINRVNAIRPVFQKLANLAKVCECSLILISHVNKRAQGENANNAATGSTDFINAARSAVRVIFDETDEDSRIMIHTKTNYAGYGRSVRYRIVEGGVEWCGFSDITKQTLEAAARKRATPWEVMQRTDDRETVNEALIAALKKSANQFVPTRISYERFKKDFGELIFGGMQPKRALDSVKEALSDAGYFLKSGMRVKDNGQAVNGFLIQKIESEIPEQIKL